MTLTKCKLITTPKMSDGRGNLSFVEVDTHIPFSINRVYFIFDVKKDIKRGCHAHYNLQQYIIALSGSFDIKLDDGLHSKVFRLDDPCTGLYLAPMMWRELYNFSPGAVCLVLASEKYDEMDYIREYDQFLHEVNADQ